LKIVDGPAGTIKLPFRKLNSILCGGIAWYLVNKGPIIADLLAERGRKAAVEVWAYCLMPNHVHLVLVRSGPNGLARAIGETHRQYTGFVNTLRAGSGICFRAAFARSRSTTHIFCRPCVTSRSIRFARGWSRAP
jgi:hypothetical protein